MKAGETVYLSDGAYLHFDGHSFELLANHHEHPTDRVCLDPIGLGEMLRHVRETTQTPNVETLKSLRNKISDFDRVCSAQEYTDTEDAWELLHAISDGLRDFLRNS